MNEPEILTTKNLILKVLKENDAPLVLDFISKDKELFSKYEAHHPSFFYSLSYQMSILKNEYNGFLNQVYLRYYVFLKNDPDTIIGTISFGNILPSPYMSCTIGYKFASAHHKKGYAYESIPIAVESAFNYLNMHKINAFIMTDNIPSVKLMEKCDFHQEGFCSKHLKINNIWQDHYLYSKISDVNI